MFPKDNVLITFEIAGYVQMVSRTSPSRQAKASLYLPGLQASVGQTQFAGLGPSLCFFSSKPGSWLCRPSPGCLFEMSLHRLQLRPGPPNALTRVDPTLLSPSSRAPDRGLATAAPTPRCSSCILAGSQPIILSKLACIK